MSRRRLTLTLVLHAWLTSACQTFAFREPKQRSEVVVAAWAEPARLPPGGGQVQILVRVHRPSGEPYPGVQVRLKASEGKLFSAGRPLVTDAAGMTRDRLTAKRSSEVVVLAGVTRHRFNIEMTPGN